MGGEFTAMLHKPHASSCCRAQVGPGGLQSAAQLRRVCTRPAAPQRLRVQPGARPLLGHPSRQQFAACLRAAPAASPETEAEAPTEAELLAQYRAGKANSLYDIRPGISGYEGPPPTQHEAPRGLMPDLQDDPLTIDDAVEEEDPDLRQQMMDDLAMKAGILPGQPMYPQPAVSSLADFVPFELVQFAKDEITHAVSVTVNAPVERVFDFWRERAGYARWFDLIHSSAEVLSSTEHPIHRVAEPYLEDAPDTPGQDSAEPSSQGAALDAVRQPAVDYGSEAAPEEAPSSFDLPDLSGEASEESIGEQSEAGPSEQQAASQQPKPANLLAPRADRGRAASVEAAAGGAEAARSSESAGGGGGEQSAEEGEEDAAMPEAAENTLNLFMFYRWGQMPKLELFTSLVRTDMAENSYILEEALEGMHLAAGAFFSEVEEGTKVELRLAYFLPEPLKQYVGPVGIYADVDEILQQNMQTMKELVETGDLEEFREWCNRDRLAAQGQLASMEMLMSAEDMQQAVVDSICADYHRLTQGTPAAGGQAENSHAGAPRKSRNQQRDRQTVDTLRASLCNLRDVLNGGENDAAIPAYDAGQLQLMQQYLGDKPELRLPFVTGIERGLAWLDGDDSASQPPEIIEPRQQAGQATSMDTPTSTARDAVGPSEGPQGFNEYPTDSTPSQSIDSEGGGQEAEGATARFTTPSGVVSSPPGSGGGDTSAASSAGGASASSPSEGGSEGGSGDPEGQPPAERVEEEQPGREQGSGTTSTTSPGSAPDNDRQAAEEATPSGPVKPKRKRAAPKKKQ